MVDSEVRCINKRFRCENCNNRFRRLVQYDQDKTTCEKCNSQEAYEVIESEFNKEEADRTYRLTFDHTNRELERQYHPTTDVLDRDPTNIYGDPQRRRVRVTESERTQPSRTTPQRPVQEQPRTPTGGRTPQARASPTQPQRQTQSIILAQPNFFLQQFFIPYTISPFHGSVHRQRRQQPIQNIVGNLFSDFFLIPNNEFFEDNFASNFTSNFDDPMTRIVFLQSMQQNQPSGTPPASKEALKKLKKFAMTEEFCNKDEKGNIEYPSCSVCLVEIGKGEETLLIPCGHMFHSPCINKWLEMHNNCPVCRYELPTDDPDYERTRQQRQNGYTNGNGASGSRTNTTRTGQNTNPQSTSQNINRNFNGFTFAR
jgi:hypothetical protein